MKIPQFKPWIGKEEYDSISDCFEANWITEGPKAQEFDKKLRELTGAKYGVFAPNGTLGLFLALKALNIKKNDEVIVPDFTFIGSANAVEMTGAKPVFCDVNKQNFQIDLDSAEKTITKKTKAIMPVHIYGTMVEMDKIIDFAKKHNLVIIEDAAQAIGVKYNSQHAGTFGDIGVFSFFADKTITTGEGGYIVTNCGKTYNNLLFLRNQGRLNRGTFIHPEIGYNFRITDMQAAIGLTQLSKLNDIINRKRNIKNQYFELLKNIPEISFFEPPKKSDWIPFRVGIICKKAHELMNYLMENGIEPRTFFYPLHKQPCYNKSKKNLHNNDSFFPNSIYAYQNGICLPTFPELKEIEIEYICSTIKKFYETH